MTSDLKGVCYHESQITKCWEKAGYIVTFSDNLQTVRITLAFPEGMTHSKRERRDAEDRPNQVCKTNISHEHDVEQEFEWKG